MLGRPESVEDGLVADALIEQHSADAVAVGVGPDDAGQGRLGAEGAEQRGDAAGAAEALLAAVGAQEDDRRLLADALGVAPDVAVEHQVADDQHARLAEVLNQLDQIGGHRRSLATSAWVRDALSSYARPRMRLSQPPDTAADVRHATAACSSGSRTS